MAQNKSADLTFMGPCIVIILIYIQQHATLHSFFNLETTLHVSGGTITHHQERKQLYLQHLVSAYATHSTLKPVSTLLR